VDLFLVKGGIEKRLEEDVGVVRVWKGCMYSMYSHFVRKREGSDVVSAGCVGGLGFGGWKGVAILLGGEEKEFEAERIIVE